LIYYKNALLLANKIKLWKQAAMISNNIGAIYIDLKDKTAAEKYLLNAVSIFKKHHILYTEGLLTYRLLATFYDRIGKYEESKKIYLEVINYAKKINDIELYTFSMAYYSSLLLKLNQVQEALKFTNEAVLIQRKQHDDNILSVLLGPYALALKENKRYDEAIAI